MTPTTETAPSATTVIKIKRDQHQAVRQLTLTLSASLGRRLSQSDALYLAARYVLANADQAAPELAALLAAEPAAPIAS
jgi:hypothetical protein